MKRLICVLAIGSGFSSASLQAQSDIIADTVVISAMAHERPIFKALAIVTRNQRQYLEFEVRKVDNVRNSRIEAGDTTSGLALIGTMAPRCNSVMPSCFAFPLDIGLNQYKYYRVVQVSMAHEWTPSPVLNHFPKAKDAEEYVQRRTINANGIAGWLSTLQQ